MFMTSAPSNGKYCQGGVTNAGHRYWHQAHACIPLRLNMCDQFHDPGSTRYRIIVIWIPAAMQQRGHKMDLGINGRNAIVCASSRGLGRACAQALGEAGCRVVINGVDAQRLDQTAEDLRALTGAEIIPVAGDVSLAATQEALIAAAGDTDILVNNNGGPPFKDFRELDREAMLKGCVQNMVTPIELIQKVIDGMAERGFGRIVNITSGSVKQPITGLDLSSGARAGLTAFVAGVTPKYLAYNVTINHLLPGMFDTDRLRSSFAPTAKLTGKSLDQVEEDRRKTVPANRFGTPDEFGKTCAFLCSAHAGYIANQNVLIDGGRYQGCW